MKKEKKVKVPKIKPMKKIDMIKLEEERTAITLKLMNMSLIKHSPEHIKLKEELHRIHAIIKGENIEGEI
jgi:hypothetical protein